MNTNYKLWCSFVIRAKSERQARFFFIRRMKELGLYGDIICVMEDGSNLETSVRESVIDSIEDHGSLDNWA